jgi:hypothetical protein
VQVNHAGTLTVTPDGVDDSFLPNGKLDPDRPPDQQPGQLVTRFAYDGLGLSEETECPAERRCFLHATAPFTSGYPFANSVGTVPGVEAPRPRVGYPCRSP